MASLSFERLDIGCKPSSGKISPGKFLHQRQRYGCSSALNSRNTSTHVEWAALFGVFRGLQQPSSVVAKKKTLNVRCLGLNDIREDNEPRENMTSGDDLRRGNGTHVDGIRDTGGFRTVAAEITPRTDEFFVSEADGDPDCPSEGFSSIDQAINAIRQGKFVIAVDDEDTENEGDLIMAASFVTPETMAFLVKHGTGIVCVGMKEEDLERLRLPLMVPTKENEEGLPTAFTVSVDAKVGTSTGMSAADRANTVLALASPHSKLEDFRQPGHIFPLKYRRGGVLERSGHTEASVDLATLAGLRPAAVLSQIVDDDGSIARLPKIQKLATKYNLPIISILDLIRYKRKREKLVKQAAVCRLPTKWGSFQVYCYHSKLDGIEHVALVKGNIGDGQDVLVRVHSECLTGDIFGSARCDCGNQLASAMQQIEQVGRGVLVYLRGHEGRGIGLAHKLRAYNLQDQGHDTVEANVELGLSVDSREYGIGAQILRDIGVRTMKLMTNNPAKFIGLKGYGLAVVGRVPVLSPITEENKRYLETKRSKMGHVYGSDLPGSFAGLLYPKKKRKMMIRKLHHQLKNTARSQIMEMLTYLIIVLLIRLANWNALVFAFFYCLFVF